MPPPTPQGHRYLPTNAGWHIWFCRLLVFDWLDCTNLAKIKSFYRARPLSWRIKNKQESNHLAQNAHVSSFSFKYGLSHWKKGLKSTDFNTTDTGYLTVGLSGHPPRTIKIFSILSDSPFQTLSGPAAPTEQINHSTTTTTLLFFSCSSINYPCHFHSLCDFPGTKAPIAKTAQYSYTGRFFNKMHIISLALGH